MFGFLENDKDKRVNENYGIDNPIVQHLGNYILSELRRSNYVENVGLIMRDEMYKYDFCNYEGEEEFNLVLPVAIKLDKKKLNDDFKEYLMSNDVLNKY